MEVKDTFFSRKVTLNCNGTLVDLSTPRIMGIINVTPDSFYDGGRYPSEKDILGHVEKMIDEGADFIDVGAMSSRPGAAEVSPDEEHERLVSALDPIRTRYPDILISVDTMRSEIARMAVLNYNVSMINDISGGIADEQMLHTIASLRVPYIIMHMKGTPANMQENPRYEDLFREVLAFFSERITKAREAGIHDIIIDPGLGFGKTLQHNFQLLSGLGMFELLDLPIMVGISRKSMVYRTLENTPDEALNGTTVLHTIALMNGTNILRVHDVKEAREAVKLVEKLKSSNL